MMQLFLQVVFGSKTPEECKERWSLIQDHLRHYRLMKELVDDGLKWTENRWSNFNKGAKVYKSETIMRLWINQVCKYCF